MHKPKALSMQRILNYTLAQLKFFHLFFNVSNKQYLNFNVWQFHMNDFLRAIYKWAYISLWSAWAGQFQMVREYFCLYLKIIRVTKVEHVQNNT